MLQALGVVLLTLAVVALSIFLLGLGSLLKGRCVLRRCGVDGPTGDACDGCPGRSSRNRSHRSRSKLAPLARVRQIRRWLVVSQDTIRWFLTYEPQSLCARIRRRRECLPALVNRLPLAASLPECLLANHITPTAFVISRWYSDFLPSQATANRRVPQCRGR